MVGVGRGSRSPLLFYDKKISDMNEIPNLRYIDQLAGEDVEFRKKFIAILKEEFPEEKLEYKTNILKKAYREASENVHKIKHKLNILGLNNAHSLAVRYELELRNEASLLSNEFETILEGVENYLKTI